MLFRREKRRVPELNTTSTADISFMLLIFFLVTTSMDTDKGLSRQLPPPNPVEEQQPAAVREGLVLHVHIAENNTLSVNDSSLSVSELRNRIKSHVQQSGKEHVIELKAERTADYNTYFQVQNELVAAYRELRDTRAKEQFGHVYALCTEQQQEQLREEIPQHVSEIYLTRQEGGEP